MILSLPHIFNLILIFLHVIDPSFPKSYCCNVSIVQFTLKDIFRCYYKPTRRKQEKKKNRPYQAVFSRSSWYILALNLTAMISKSGILKLSSYLCLFFHFKIELMQMLQMAMQLNSLRSMSVKVPGSTKKVNIFL